MKPIHLLSGILLFAVLTGCSEKEPEPPKRQRPPVSEIEGTELARIKLPADGEDFEYSLELNDRVEYVYVDLDIENTNENYEGDFEITIRQSSGEHASLFSYKEGGRLSSWTRPEDQTARYVRFVEHPGVYEIKGTSWHEMGGNVYLMVKDITEHVKEYDPSAVTNIEEAISILRESDHYSRALRYLEKYLRKSPDPFKTSIELFPQFFRPSVTIQSNDFIDDQYAVLKLNISPHVLSTVGGPLKVGVLINGTNQVVVFVGQHDSINLTSYLIPDEKNTIQPFWSLIQKEAIEAESQSGEQHVSTSTWVGEPIEIPDTSKRLILRVEGRIY